jgi:hypothetical protein
VPDGVAWRKDGINSRQVFIAVLDEVQSVSVRDEVLTGGVDKGLELFRFALVGPEVEVGLCNVELRIGEVARFVVDIVPTEMANVCAPTDPETKFHV